MYICIPLAGKGERFWQAGYTDPKPMIKIYEKPILAHVLDNLQFSEDDEVLIIYHQDLEQYGFIEYFRERYSFLHFFRVGDTRGAVETVFMGLSSLNDSQTMKDQAILLLDCDTFYTADILSSARSVSTTSGGLFYFEQEVNGPPVFSYTCLNREKIVTRVMEKERISNNANTGAYLFPSSHALYKAAQEVLDKKLMTRNEFYTSRLIQHMVEGGEVFRGIPLETHQVIFLGTPLQVKEYMTRSLVFLFDLDGTLVDTDDIYLRVWKTLLDPYHVDCTPQIFNDSIQGNSDSVAMASLFPLLSPDQVRQISEQKDHLFLTHLHHIREIPGALSFLRKVKSHGHRIAIVTNCNRLAAETILEKSGLASLSEYLVIGNECLHPKPSPHPYWKAMELFQTSPERCIIFEDSRSGLKSARGAKPQHLVGISKSGVSLHSWGADQTIQTYDEFPTIDALLYGTKSEIPRLENLILKQFGNILSIQSVRIDTGKLKGGYIADTLRVEITQKDGGIVDCVLKLPSQDPRVTPITTKTAEHTSLEGMARFLDLYAREYYFYENMQSFVSLRTPHCYGILRNQDMLAMGILMENLNQPDFTLNLTLGDASVDVSLTILDRLARMHAQFWDKDIPTIFPALQKNRDFSQWSDFLSSRWSIFEKKWAFLLTPVQLRLGETIIHNFASIQQHLSESPLTICHGDVKSPNIFYQKKNNSYEPYFIDWQYVFQGKGVQDVVFFIIESFSIPMIRLYTPLFREYYFTKLVEHGVRDYDRRLYEKDFAMAARCFPFFVAVWFGSLPREELIDVNFPFFFIRKAFYFIENFSP